MGCCAPDSATSPAAPRHSPHWPSTTGGSKSRSEDDIQYEQQPLSKPEAGATPVSTTNNTPAEALPGLSAAVPAQDEPPAPDEPPTQPPPALAEQSPPNELSSAVEDAAAKSAKEAWWDAQKAEESSRRRAAEAPVAALECGGVDYISEAGAQAQVRTSPRKPGGEGGAVSPRNSEWPPFEPKSHRPAIRTWGQPTCKKLADPTRSPRALASDNGPAEARAEGPGRRAARGCHARRDAGDAPRAAVGRAYIGLALRSKYRLATATVFTVRARGMIPRYPRPGPALCIS